MPEVEFDEAEVETLTLLLLLLLLLAMACAMGGLLREALSNGVEDVLLVVAVVVVKVEEDRACLSGLSDCKCSLR